MSQIINPFRFGGTFSPDQVTGLYQWLKADAITGLNNGDAIATWEDSSGNNRDATQATGANQPTYQTNVVNSLPVVRFDGSDDYLLLGDFSALTEGEVFIVIKIDADPPGADAQSGLAVWGSSSSAAHFPYTDGTIYDDFGSTTRKTTVNPTPALTSWRVYNVWSVSGDWASNLDGSSLYSTATNTVSFPASVNLGISFLSIYFLDGDVAEFIMYDNKLSNGDRSSVQTYLDTKYAL